MNFHIKETDSECVKEAKQKLHKELKKLEQALPAIKAVENCKRLLDDIPLRINYEIGLYWSGATLTYRVRDRDSGAFEDIERILTRLRKEGYKILGKAEKRGGNGIIFWTLKPQEGSAYTPNQITFHAIFPKMEELPSEGCVFLKKGERQVTETIYEITCSDGRVFEEKVRT